MGESFAGELEGTFTGLMARGRRLGTAVIADRCTLARQGIRHLFDGSLFLVVAEATRVRAVEDALRTLRPDLLMLDINLENRCVIAEIPRLLEVSPRTRILALSRDGDPHWARKALGAGVHGYVSKEAPAEDLARAIRAIQAGNIYLEIQPLIPVRDSVDRLTPREYDVLCLMAAGYTNREIAQRLFVSVRTIEAERARMKSKLGIKTRAELVSFARQA